MSTAAGPSLANGAFPDEFSIHFPANAPHRIFIGANFGLLVSEDDGGTWRYSCEPWVVSSSNAALSNENVSFYQVTADGAVLADSVTLTRSADVACTWPTATGSVTGAAVTDMFADPNDANLVLAIVVTSTGSYIVASHNGGVSFEDPHLYDTQNDTHDLLTGIEIARSTPGVVYATSVSTSGGAGKFLVSTAAGAPGSWTPSALPIDSATQPRILSVDPSDAKKVYLRLLSGPSDSMMVTADGGKTFDKVLTISGRFSSFLRAGDGSLYAGQDIGKLWVWPVGAAGFENTPRAAPHLRCLGQRPGSQRIYGCADMLVDGFSLAYSDDSGATFHPVMSFTQILGPLTCVPVKTNCEPHWERIQGVLGIGAAADAGQGNVGGNPSPGGGSHCGSVGAGAAALFILLAFSVRRAKS